MVALVDKVKIVIFNKHGLNLGLETLNKLFNNYDIICVQELWVRPNELHCVQNLHNEFNCSVVSA